MTMLPRYPEQSYRSYIFLPCPMLRCQPHISNVRKAMLPFPRPCSFCIVLLTAVSGAVLHELYHCHSYRHVQCVPIPTFPSTRVALRCGVPTVTEMFLFPLRHSHIRTFPFSHIPFSHIPQQS